MVKSSQLLHERHAHKVWAFLNRIHALLQILATAPIFYFRVWCYFCNNEDMVAPPLVAWLMVFGGEMLFLLSWLLKQSYYWRPVTRSVFPENLPEDDKLPNIDVFVCTVDPVKEPTFDVMNTVISAMSLDYPASKLSVYVSDDGAAPVTLDAIKHAWVFATWWLPFCKRYNITPISPKPFFQQQHSPRNKDFIQEYKLLKEKYEEFEERVRCWKGRTGDDNNAERSTPTPQHHSPIIQVINEKCVGNAAAATINPENINTMPFLVYVAREKRPSHHHHFKAGALNVLQRVSSIMSNAPYILVLDCDMYCNDSISARQAMCFYLDTHINTTSSIAWVQFPQKFHNVNDKDVYDSQMRASWPIIYPGCDGLQGPILSGTNFYIKRKALYGFHYSTAAGKDNINELRLTFGSSNQLIKSLSCHIHDNHHQLKPNEFSCDNYLPEAQFLASCVYEEDTQWGKQVGFRYDTVVEDVMTGYLLHGEGWKSVYLNPKRAQFLGSATTNLNEALIQYCRWSAGLIQLGISKYSPVFYRSPRMEVLQRLMYAWAAFFPLDFLPILCFAIIQPLCLLYGIPLYPKVSNPLLLIPYGFVFISSNLKHLCEAYYICGGRGWINAWLNEQRIVVIKGLTSYVYGTLDCVMGRLGIRETSFVATNKADDDDKSKWYLNGNYDFRTSNMFLVPVVTAVTLNLSSFVVGVARVFIVGNNNNNNNNNIMESWDTMFAQAFLSFYMLIISVPVIEAMLLRMDKASIPLSTTFISTLLSCLVLIFGQLIVS